MCTRPLPFSDIILNEPEELPALMHHLHAELSPDRRALMQSVFRLYGSLDSEIEVPWEVLLPAGFAQVLVDIVMDNDVLNDARYTVYSRVGLVTFTARRYYCTPH